VREARPDFEGNLKSHHFQPLTTANKISVHVIAGLGGWLTITAMGVSYRLLSMFMLAPEADKPTTRIGTALRFPSAPAD
jgi:tRNA A22 N-methylase